MENKIPQCRTSIHNIFNIFTNYLIPVILNDLIAIINNNVFNRSLTEL
jgi:hypothetical protein